MGWTGHPGHSWGVDTKAPPYQERWILTPGVEGAFKGLEMT